MSIERIPALGLIAVSSRAQANKDRAGRDKISLEEQLRAITQRANEENWDLFEVLTLPGVSRSDPDIIKMFIGNEPKFAPYRRFRELTNNKGYKVLITYDFARLGRSKSLFTYIAENAIASRAKVCVIQSGMMDENDQDLQIPLGSIWATAGLKRAKDMWNAAMDRKAETGWPTSGKLLISHRYVYDKDHHLIGCEINPEMRPMLDNLAEVLCNGYSWSDISRELFRRGFGSPSTNQPYDRLLLWRMLNNPYFWGHSARHYLNEWGAWAYDRDIPPPDGVKLHYDTHEPVYTGEQAEAVKAALRIPSNWKGGARRQGQYRFAALLVCWGCGASLRVHTSPHYKRTGTGYCTYTCATRWIPSLAYKCTLPSATKLPEKKAIAYMDSLLAHWEQTTNYELPVLEDSRNKANDVAVLRRRLSDLERRINEAVSLQVDADEAARPAYTAKVRQLSEEKRDVLQELVSLQDSVESREIVQDRVSVIESIKEMGRVAFWAQDPPLINRALRRIFGKHRLIVLNGEIQGYGIVKRQR
jgi:hypothetical protein